MTYFFGREEELARLKEVLGKETASLVIMKGRRRIGKSRLCQEFGKVFDRFLTFSGIPPSKGLTAQEQREDFSKQMSRALKIPPFMTQDWGDLFYYLAKETKKGQVLIIFDEINWMGNCDPTFLGKLKTAWDEQFSKNPRLVMILCGSLSGWIEKNILTNTGFVGRISKSFTLKELPLPVCDLFWKKWRFKVAPYEKFKFLSVSGGIPKYLEEMIPSKTAEQNILSLCFQSDGLLFREFDQLFHDLFSKKSHKYRTILQALSTGSKTLEELYKFLKIKKTGYVVSEYLTDLEEGGFIQRDFTWNLNNQAKSRLSVFRLSDNYSRFYLKVIEPNKDRIQRGILKKTPSYETIMGLQFENLVLNNRFFIYSALELDPNCILVDNPYFQNQTKKTQGCQIDYMIQTEYGVLYPTEIKFSKRKVGLSVMHEMQEKIKRLSPPKSLSIRPILIHANGVTPQVAKSGYFSRIIDFSTLFKS